MRKLVTLLLVSVGIINSPVDDVDWIKMVVDGDQITYYHSEDGVNWVKGARAR